MLNLRLFFALIVIMAICGGAQGKQLSLPQNQLIQIPSGITSTDLTGDGVPDTILKIWRENFNAHSYFITQFIKGTIDPKTLTGSEKIKKDSEGGLSGSEAPEAIGVEKNSGAFEHELISSGGADCVMHDYRVFIKNKKIFLVTGDIGLNEHFCSEDFVDFQIYKMAMNSEGVPGDTLFYFKPLKDFKSESKFSDVAAAFNANEKNIIGEVK